MVKFVGSAAFVRVANAARSSSSTLLLLSFLLAVASCLMPVAGADAVISYARDAEQRQQEQQQRQRQTKRREQQRDGRRLEDLLSAYEDGYVDALVYYTKSAVQSLPDNGGSSAMREHIRTALSIINDYLGMLVIPRGIKQIRIAGLWELPYADGSKWVDWVSSNITEGVVESFATNRVLNRRRKRFFSSDIMVLVHDWSSSITSGEGEGQDFAYFGWDLANGVVLIDSDVVVDENFDPTSLLSDPSFAQEIPFLVTIGANEDSAGTSPVLDDSVSGRLTSSFSRRCPTGFRGVGYHRYDDGDGRETLRLRLLCKSSIVFTIGRRFPPEDQSSSIERVEPVSCPNGQIVDGVGLMWYRIEEEQRDLYRVAVHCPESNVTGPEGAWYTSSEHPGATLVSEQYRGFWDTQVGERYAMDGGDADVAATYIRFNSFAKGKMDTVSLDVGFAPTTSRSSLGSVLQDMDTYSCIRHMSSKSDLVYRAICKNKPYEKWFMSLSDGSIRTTNSDDMCLEHLFRTPTNVVKMKACDLSSSNAYLQWIFDAQTLQFKTNADDGTCLTVLGNGRTYMRPCNDDDKNQKFIFDPDEFFWNDAVP